MIDFKKVAKYLKKKIENGEKVNADGYSAFLVSFNHQINEYRPDDIDLHLRLTGEEFKSEKTNG